MLNRIARREAGFTLIELLVVILIIAILIAIAAPSFLNQQNKAKDSAAQQALAVAYQDAKAYSVNYSGAFGGGAAGADGTTASVANLAAYIASAEPQYNVGLTANAGTNVPTPGANSIYVVTSATGTTANTFNNLKLESVSSSGTLQTLTVTGGSGPTYGTS